MSLRLGNDVVDLRAAENLRSALSPRYRDRVLAAPERHALRDRADLELLFLAYWAAKESAFKALGRTQPDLVFAHRRFVVHELRAMHIGSGDGSACGEVRVGATSIDVRWDWTQEWVHCVTATTGDAVRWQVGTIEQWDGHASQPQAASPALPAQSRAARILAANLLADRGIEDAHITSTARRGRRGPPSVICAGVRREDVRVSLSHDGRYVAAAVLTGIQERAT